MSVIDWLFRDRRTGRIVIGQWPNLALIVFILSSSMAWLLERTGASDGLGPLTTGLRLAAVSSLVWWSIDEVARGVNPWRRCLGAAVLAYALWRAWHLTL